jgi:GLPGLI family protein
MKKLVIYSTALVMMAAAMVAQAQDKLKEGKATFEISYPDAEEMNDQMLAMMPKESVTYFKGSKRRAEVQTSFSNMVMIEDPDKKESYMCIDAMGKKTAVKSTEADMEKTKAEMGEYDVKLSDETKKIAGYTCKKAVVTMKKDDNTFDVWYTPDLPYDNASRHGWKGVEGFPLEFTLEQKAMGGNVKTKLICTSVKKAEVSDDMFKVPEGYTVMTREEAKKQWGGN